MATRNPFGTVALGQEGSGLAQILTPYDSAKYDNAIIEQEQTRRKEEAKALQEEAKTLKAPDKINPTKYWNKDFELYSKEFDAINDGEKDLFLEFAYLSNNIPNAGQDPTEWRKRKYEYDLKQIEQQKKLKDWEHKVALETQNKEDYEYAEAYVSANTTKIDPIKQEKIYKNFFEPPKELVDRFDGNVEKARAYYTYEIMGGKDGLIAHQFDWAAHNKRVKDATATTAKELAGSDIEFDSNQGLWVNTSTKRKVYDQNQMKALTLSAIASDKNALIFFRDEEPELKNALDLYAKDKNTKRELLSTSDVYDFLASENPVAKDYLQRRYYWNNSSETNKSFQQSNDGYGSGADIQTSLNDGTKQMKTKGNVFLEIVNTWGSENLRPQVSTNSLVTTNMSGKYIRKAGAMWTPSTRSESALKGEDAPRTPQRLKSTSIESNTIVIAKDNIDVNLGGQKITIKKGSAPPQELLNNKQFVSDNYNKLDYQIWSTAIFTDDATKLDNPISSPIEDMETLYTKDGYEEALKRNRVEFTPDGKILYYEDGELVNKDEQKNTQSSGSSGIEWK